MSVRPSRIDFCLLTENDLEKADREIGAKIEQARNEWKNRALTGERHAFLIVAISPTIAYAKANGILHGLAARLCELYLGVNSSDQIHLDDLILRLHDDSEPRMRSWKAGVNYFSAQADQRWWHDHRIPGGMAFSMNSVGHMARVMAERALSKDTSLRTDEVPREKLVYWALPKAMRTIGPPESGSKRGTSLAEHGRFEEDRVPPTFDQRTRHFADLAGFSENRYLGRYHTDHTIPSGYFNEGLWREDDLKLRDDLYFTYLHQPGDSDYLAMGLGQEIEARGRDRASAHFGLSWQDRRLAL